MQVTGHWLASSSPTAFRSSLFHTYRIQRTFWFRWNRKSIDVTRTSNYLHVSTFTRSKQAIVLNVDKLDVALWPLWIGQLFHNFQWHSAVSPIIPVANETNHNDWLVRQGFRLRWFSRSSAECWLVFAVKNIGSLFIRDWSDFGSVLSVLNLAGERHQKEHELKIIPVSVLEASPIFQHSHSRNSSTV